MKQRTIMKGKEVDNVTAKRKKRRTDLRERERIEEDSIGEAT